MRNAHSQNAALTQFPYADPGLAGKRHDAGQIKKLDRKHHRIKLVNGKWFIAPSAVDIKAFQIGEAVEVSYELTHHHYYASSIKPV